MHDDRSGPAALGGAGLLIAAALGLVALHSALAWQGHVPQTLHSIADRPLTRAMVILGAAAGVLCLAGAAAASPLSTCAGPAGARATGSGS